jgi:hypothetical protein
MIKARAMVNQSPDPGLVYKIKRPKITERYCSKYGMWFLKG